MTRRFRIQMKVALEPASVRGFRFAGVSAGLKTKAGALDLGLIVADRPCAAAAVFSANRVKAAPVYVTADRVKSGRLQAVVANSGCANSFTGKEGMRLARDSCAHVAQLLGCAPELVVPSSTGVIGHLYDFAKFKNGAADAVRALREDGLSDFAHAIMTTDTRPKTASTTFKAGGATITLAGAVKGVGMISPKMATMLGYLVTDAMIAPAALKKSLKAALPTSFNAITVDGDMSTNDTVIIMASGAAENRAFGARDQLVFDRAVEEVSAALARELVRDGEGATKLVTVEVRGARTVCRRRTRGSSNRELAAGQDCVLRMRSERRPNPHGRWIVRRVRRVRQAGTVDWRCEGCRARPITHRSVGRRGHCDESARIRGSARSAIGKIDRDDSYLRPELRLRANQRGVHDLREAKRDGKLHQSCEGGRRA